MIDIEVINMFSDCPMCGKCNPSYNVELSIAIISCKNTNFRIEINSNYSMCFFKKPLHGIYFTYCKDRFFIYENGIRKDVELLTVQDIYNYIKKYCENLIFE